MKFELKPDNRNSSDQEKEIFSPDSIVSRGTFLFQKLEIIVFM